MTQEHQITSCSSRSFRALILTQFLGACNDNLFKTVVSLLLLNTLLNQAGGIIYLSLTAALFFIPYVLFSAFAGYLADRFSKTKILQQMKLLEVVVMAGGLLAFNYNSTWGLLLAVFLMGMQSALFSPSKYGLLPEMLGLRELSKANGYLEFFTFLAIILGTASAGVVSTGNYGNPGIITLGIAVLGVVASLAIDPIPASPNPRPFKLDPIGPNLRALKELKAKKALWLSALGISFFWTFGALFQLNILLYAKQSLALNDLQTSLVLATLGLGIGFGSIFAGKASEGKVELGLVPIGSLTIVIGCFLLASVSSSLTLVYLTVCLLGAGAGLFIVPVQSYLQEFSPEDKRGAFIAASNFLSFTAMLAVSFAFWVITDFLGLSPEILFFLMGLTTIAMSIYLFRLLPEVLTRCVNWLAIHLIYRIETNGSQNIPDTGGALIVCNHVTYVDAMLLLAAFRRPVHFIMYRPIYENKLIHPVAKLMGVIPIAAEDGRESIIETLEYAKTLIEKGKLVGIFAEGGLTRDGELQDFKKGLETIMSGSTRPIIPIFLGGLWGSIFSHAGGKILWKRPKMIPYPVSVAIGEPVAACTSAAEVQALVEKLGGLA